MSKLIFLQTKHSPLHLLPVSVEGHAVISSWCIESMRSVFNDQLTFTDQTASTAQSCCFIQHKVFPVLLQPYPIWRTEDVLSQLAGCYSLLTVCMFIQSLDPKCRTASQFLDTKTLILLMGKSVIFECIEI